MTPGLFSCSGHGWEAAGRQALATGTCPAPPSTPSPLFRSLHLAPRLRKGCVLQISAQTNLPSSSSSAAG